MDSLPNNIKVKSITFKSIYLASAYLPKPYSLATLLVNPGLQTFQAPIPHWAIPQMATF